MMEWVILLSFLVGVAAGLYIAAFVIKDFHK